jgi:Ni,Fe-hydrogenase maturation factor
VDLREVLALAELRDSLPGKLVALGLQPARVHMFSGLSPEVEARMDRLLSAVIDRLERWGHPAARLERLASA